MSAGTRFLVIILVVLGVLAITAGVIYLAEPAKSLPTFFPGYAAHLAAPHRRRGFAGVLVGVVLLVIGLAVARTARSPHYHR